MNVNDIMQLLQQEGLGVRRDIKTRDHLLFGDAYQEVKHIGVCWVASKEAIRDAIDKGIDLIITHENPFYQCSTQMHTAAMNAAEEKKALLQEHAISVYRCHDVWDRIREYGVADQWAKRLGFNFEERALHSFYQAAQIPVMTSEELAKHTASVLHKDGEDGVYMFGDTQKKISRIAIGTGAATNLYEMLAFHSDAVIVSDDGIQTFDVAQFAIDQHIPMIVVNHAACEIAGCKAMVPWLTQRVCDGDVIYLSQDISIHYYMASMKEK